MKPGELQQCHAVIYSIQQVHNPEREETPWAVYNNLCDLFEVSKYVRQFDVTRLVRLPRLQLRHTDYRRQISTDYQLLKFHQAVDFMLLSVTEEQYGYIIRYFDEHKDRDNASIEELRSFGNVYKADASISAKTNELFEQFNSASVPKEVADS